MEQKLIISVDLGGLVLELWDEPAEYVERLPNGEVVQRQILPVREDFETRYKALLIDQQRNLLPLQAGDIYYEGEWEGRIYWVVTVRRAVWKRFTKLQQACDYAIELNEPDARVQLAAHMTKTDATGSKTESRGWKILSPDPDMEGARI